MKRTPRVVEEWLDAELDGAGQIGQLMALHARLKLLLMAHSPALSSVLGRIVAGARHADRDALVAAYRSTAKLALATEPTRGRHVNALAHMAGYFKRAPVADRRALAESIDAYRRGDVPLSTPLQLVRAQARRHGVAYVAQQLYLEAA